MSEIKLKEVPMTTLDGKPIVVGAILHACQIAQKYNSPWGYQVNKYRVEYVNNSGRTYMVKELSKGLEYRYSNGKCHLYSSQAAAKKALKTEARSELKTIKLKVKRHNKNIKFLESLLK